MDERLSKIISDYDVTIQKAELLIKHFIYSLFEPNSFSEEERKDSLNLAHREFLELIKIFSVYGKFKDKFSSKGYHGFPSGINNRIISEKINFDMNIGIDNGEYFVDAWFIKPQLIKYMSDKFWLRIAQLSLYGEFEFCNNASIESKEAQPFLKLFTNKKSNLFNLMRDYLFLTMYEEDVMNLGSLNIRWSINTDFFDLVGKMAQTFKLLYEINYELWRVEYLQNQRIAKKIKLSD